MTESKTAIIFDMDGVLVDSEAYYYERRKAFLAEFDLTIEGLILPESRCGYAFIMAKD